MLGKIRRIQINEVYSRIQPTQTAQDVFALLDTIDELEGSLRRLQELWLVDTQESYEYLLALLKRMEDGDADS